MGPKVLEIVFFVYNPQNNQKKKFAVAMSPLYGLATRSSKPSLNLPKYCNLQGCWILDSGNVLIQQDLSQEGRDQRISTVVSPESLVEIRASQLATFFVLTFLELTFKRSK